MSQFQGVTQADRLSANLGGQRYLGGRWFVYSNANFEHNLELDLDGRTSLLGGLGKNLIQTNRASLKLSGGMLYNRENYTAEPGGNNVAGTISTTARIFKLYSPKVDVETEFYVIPVFNDWGRVRLELNSGMKFELFFKDFFWNVSFYESFDSKPPSKNPIRNDYGVVTGLSWSFRK